MVKCHVCGHVDREISAFCKKCSAYIASTVHNKALIEKRFAEKGAEERLRDTYVRVLSRFFSEGEEYLKQTVGFDKPPSISIFTLIVFLILAIPIMIIGGLLLPFGSERTLILLSTERVFLVKLIDSSRAIDLRKPPIILKHGEVQKYLFKKGIVISTLNIVTKGKEYRYWFLRPTDYFRDLEELLGLTSRIIYSA